jgi:hypothetical protein
MFYDADEALHDYLETLAWNKNTPRLSIYLPVNHGQDTYETELAAYNLLPKLLPGGVDVGMPDIIPSYGGAKAYIDSFSTDKLGLHTARNYVEVEYPLIITVLTSGLASERNIHNKKICGLILKALARNTTLGLEHIQITIPSEGTVRWGIMPSNRINYNGKGSKNFAGQILIFVEESDII